MCAMPSRALAPACRWGLAGRNPQDDPQRQPVCRAYDDPNGLVTVGKSLLINVLPELAKNGIWTAEKLECFAIARDRSMYVVTDNDGLDDSPGETVFLKLGRLR